MLAVEARQTFVARNPEKPILRLEDVIDDIRAQSIFRGERGAAIVTSRRLRIKGEAWAGSGCDKS
jgi:hypothetical protein